jgi:hypothetical protein
MAKFLESEKKRISKFYSSVLYNLYVQDKVTEDEMDVIVDDILTLKEIVKSSVWRDLSFFSSRFNFTNNEIETLIESIINKELKSSITKKWINLHIDNGHYSLLDRSIKLVENNIFTFFIESSDYVEFNQTRKQKISNIFRKYYKEKILSDPKSKFVKLYFLNIERDKSLKSMEIDSKFKKIANDLFDYELDLIEKNLFKS